MPFDLSTILQLVVATMRDPAGIATRIKGMRIPHEASWLVLMISMILMVTVAHAGGLLAGVPQARILFGSGAIMDLAIIGSFTVMLVFVYYYAGRAMQGTGSFGTSLALIAWLQVITLVIALAQFATLFVLPVLGQIVSLVGAAIQIICLLHFLNVLHDFQSLWKTAGLIVVSFVGLAFGLALLIVLVQAVGLVGVS